MEINNHPSQYQTPINSNSYLYQSQVNNDNEYMNKKKNRTFGQIINIAFWLSILFVTLSNSYTVIDNIYYVFRGAQYQFINQETLQPTTKGIVVTVMLFFVVTILLLQNR